MGLDTLHCYLMYGGRNDSVVNVQVADGTQSNGLIVGQGGRSWIHTEHITDLSRRFHVSMAIDHHLWYIVLEVPIDVRGYVLM